MKRLIFVAMLAFACGETPETQMFRVGEHRIEVVPPAGWQVLDHGRQLIFRSDAGEIILTDLGAVRPEGFRDVATAARELWRSGRDAEARTRLSELRSQPNDAREPWSDVLLTPRGTPYGEVARYFDRLLAQIDAMKPAPIESIVRDALPRLGHDQSRREVKSMRETSVDGREAMTVETWMTLTHADRRCLLVVVNAGRALAVRCDRCEGTAAEAFDDVTVGLHFAEASRK